MRDPVTWLAAFFIAPWIPAAIFGWSPVLVVNGTFFVAAVGEWGVIIHWWWKERYLRAEVLAELPPASDRWKPAALMGVGAVLLVFEFWLDTVAPTFGGTGVTLFGASSLIAGWYAWARPILLTRSGLVVGASLVPWSGIHRVESRDRLIRIEFEKPHHFYGTKLLVAANEQQEQTLLGLAADSEALQGASDGAGTG